MLCRDLHVGQTLHIDGPVEVRLLHKTGRAARLSIKARPDVKILVTENQKQEESVITMPSSEGAS